MNIAICTSSQWASSRVTSRGPTIATGPAARSIVTGTSSTSQPRCTLRRQAAQTDAQTKRSGIVLHRVRVCAHEAARVRAGARRAGARLRRAAPHGVPTSLRAWSRPKRSEGRALLPPRVPSLADCARECGHRSERGEGEELPRARQQRQTRTERGRQQIRRQRHARWTRRRVGRVRNGDGDRLRGLPRRCR